jgi:hypothetical protein
VAPIARSCASTTFHEPRCGAIDLGQNGVTVRLLRYRSGSDKRGEHLFGDEPCIEVTVQRGWWSELSDARRHRVPYL